MDDLAYARYVRRAKKAEECFIAIRELYGWHIPFRKAYLMAIKDKLLSNEEKNLINEFYPVR